VTEVYETDAELSAMQQLLDASHARANVHLRAIITADRTLSAAEIVALMTGMRTLSVATVTAGGEPRVSGVDGHLLHGRWVFTTAGVATKSRHLSRRPAVSAAYIEGDDLGVYTHGQAERLTPEHPDFAPVEEHLVAHYGSSPSSWDEDIAYWRIRPTWMVGYAFKRDELLAARGVTGTR
jgi:Pyridoxamine 5'-phosphate oxidase